jgi:hypothetical protein
MEAGERGRSLVRQLTTIPAILAVLVVGGCAGVTSDPAATSTNSPTPTPPGLEPGTVLFLTADELASGPLAVGSRVPDLSPADNPALVAAAESSSTQALAVAAKTGGGRAFDFPAACAEDEDCVHPILEVAPSETLNPGTRDFALTADVKMKPSDTTKGSNLVQKGFSTGGGGQWKMQVDTLAGRPSCVIVAPGDNTIYKVESPVSVAGSGWHTVSCVREGATLRIVVDGTSEGITVPADLELRNDAPVRIGGKSIKTGNDPFHGQIDDITLNISR